MEMVKKHSIRRLSAASAPKIAINAVPSSKYVILRMYCAQMVVSMSSYQLYSIDTYIYISFNIPH